MRVGRFLYDVQLVWTVKTVEAMTPLACPLAWTVCAPGCADFDTVRTRVKLPALSATAVPRVVESNVTTTVSPEEYPEAVAVVLLVGGPEFGEREIDAVVAKPAPAEIAPHAITRTPKDRTLAGTDRSAEIMTPSRMAATLPMCGL